MQISTVAQPTSSMPADPKASSASDGGQSGSGDFASLLFPQTAGKSGSTEIGGGQESSMGKGGQQPSSQQQQAAAQVILQMMGLPGLVNTLPVKGMGSAPETAGVAAVSTAPGQTATDGAPTTRTATESGASATGGVVYAAAFTDWVKANAPVLPVSETGVQTTKPVAGRQETASMQTGGTAANPIEASSENTGVRSTAQIGSTLFAPQMVEKAEKPSPAFSVLAPGSGVDAAASTTAPTTAEPVLHPTMPSINIINKQTVASETASTAAEPSLPPTIPAVNALNAQAAASVTAPTVAEPVSPPTTPSVNALNPQAAAPGTMITGAAAPASGGAATQSGTGGGQSAASDGQTSQNMTGKAADASIQTFPSVLPGQAVATPPVQAPVPSYAGTAVKQVATAIQDAYAAQRSELRVHLSPEDLGGITIKMVSQGGSLMVSIIADSHHTGQMLASGLDSLKSTLQSNGVPVQKADVSYTATDANGQQPTPQHHMGQHSHQQGRHTPDAPRQETRDAGETTASGFAALVNLFA